MFKLDKEFEYGLSDTKKDMWEKEKMPVYSIFFFAPFFQRPFY